MIDLTAFQQLILLDVSIRERQNGESPHGLAIKSDLEEMYGEEVNHGRLYPNLDDLVDAGLLNKSERDKRTNEYSLTEQGASAISDLAGLIHVAQGKDGANPYVDAGSVVSGLTKQTVDAD